MKKGKLMELVYAADFTKRATAVALYLINRVNRNLTCFPSVGTIARECSMGRRTAFRAIDDLVKEGFVKKEARFHKNGGQRSSLYTLIEEPEALFVKVNFNNYDKEGEADVNVHEVHEADEMSLEESENDCIKDIVAVVQVTETYEITKNQDIKEPLGACLKSEIGEVENVHEVHEADEMSPEESENNCIKDIVAVVQVTDEIKKREVKILINIKHVTWFQDCFRKIRENFYEFVTWRGCKFGTP
ncbi:MAG: helix-turn-helix domain-containing protein [Alkaliphilus sp.]